MMKKRSPAFSKLTNTFKVGVLASALAVSATASSALTTYEFTLGGFGNDGKKISFYHRFCLPK